jgi:hypothetical protein
MFPPLYFFLFFFDNLPRQLLEEHGAYWTMPEGLRNGYAGHRRWQAYVALRLRANVERYLQAKQASTSIATSCSHGLDHKVDIQTAMPPEP